MQVSDLPEDSFRHRTVEPGDFIFLEGQPADKVYVILKGQADVFIRDPVRGEIPINRMNPGHMFGEIALLRKDGKRTATVAAAGRCELLEIDRSVFDARFAKADPLVRFVMEHMMERIVGLSEKVVSTTSVG